MQAQLGGSERVYKVISCIFAVLFTATRNCFWRNLYDFCAGRSASPDEKRVGGVK